ncbi:hypothetical protein Pfo_027273 [Paulownia fortunei]|nr:hypothetical protein Pfo_027273 [Paulownia fortunei]
MESQEDLTKNFSISDFKNFMAVPLSCPDSKPISRLHFWAPTITENQQEFLDTSDLPFGLSVLRKGLCFFRRHCLSHRYCVDGESCGPPGRVFRRRFPEFCPDVDCYSVEEFELKGFAVAAGVRGYLSLPVFEPDWQCCIGVLEILTVMDGSYSLTDVIGKVSNSLEEVELKSSDVFWPFDMKKLAYNQFDNGPPEYELALTEIQKVLDVLCKTYKLPCAQTWVVTLDESSLESIISTAKMGSYMSVNKVSSFQRDCIWFHLRKGQGIIWKAFLSGTSCFCRDITQLSIQNYALVLSARKADLTGGFAICLQSTYTGNAVYIIELCLPPNQTICRQPWIFLSSLLVTMKQQFKTFKLRSGQEVGDELPVEVLKISKDDPLDSFIICQTTHDGEDPKNQGNKAPLTSCQQLIFEVGATKSGLENARINQNTASSSSVFGCSRNEGEMVHLHDITHHRSNELNAQQTTFAPLTKTGAVKTLNLREAVSPKVLEEQSGKRLRDFPDNPNVNRSTSKNLSTEPNMNRWAPRKKIKVELAFVQHKSIKEAENHMVKSTTTVQNEGSIITVKADFKGDTIKFQLSVASGMMKLKDEVMKRLKLTAGTFEIKYRHEDSIWILLDTDAGLQEYVSAIRSLDISTIKVYIVPIIPQTEATRNAVNMTVKASYKDDLIKFQLSLSAGMLELKNEMIKRLKLEAESFEIKYADENNCQISLDSDAALQNCISTMTSLQKTTMKLSIQPIRAQTAMSDESIMTVKASYGVDIIKFQLSLSSGMMNLKDEVAKRLKLEAGSFVVKYLDGDNNEILLDGDAALTNYMSAMASMGIHTVKISLENTNQ